MINCDGQATYISGLITQADLDYIKAKLAEIDKPYPVKSLRIHPQYWWRSETKEFIQAIAYLKQPEWKLMLSLPNNGFDGKPVVTVERAREILDYFDAFNIVFDMYQGGNEPFTGEYGQDGNKSKLLPAQSDEDTVSTYNAYKSVIGDKPLYACVPSVEGCVKYPKYWALDAPRDIHIAKHKEYAEYPSSSWLNWELPKWDNCIATHPQDMICSECGTWDILGRQNGDVDWESDEMIANALTALELVGGLQQEFCWHNLWSNHVSNYGNSYSLFSKKNKNDGLHTHKILEAGMITTIEIEDTKYNRIVAAMRSIYPDWMKLTDKELFNKVLWNYLKGLVLNVEPREDKEAKEKQIAIEFKEMK